MKFAILGDVHGNIFAFESAIQKIEKLNVDAIILCGDYITDLTYTKEVLNKIRYLDKKYKCYIIKGNREEYILDMHNLQDNSNWKENGILENTAYTYFDLDNEDIKYIMDMPSEIIIEIDNLPSIYISHKFYNNKKYDFKIFAHEHMQLIFTSKGSTYINAGAVGLPITNFPGTTSFTILELTEQEYTIQNFNIKYDVSKAKESVLASRLMGFSNDWGKNIIRMLETGIDACWLQIKAKEKGITLEEIVNNETVLNDMNVEISNTIKRKLGI